MKHIKIAVLPFFWVWVLASLPLLLLTTWSYDAVRNINVTGHFPPSWLESFGGKLLTWTLLVNQTTEMYYVLVCGGGRHFSTFFLVCGLRWFGFLVGRFFSPHWSFPEVGCLFCYYCFVKLTVFILRFSNVFFLLYIVNLTLNWT